jgi:ribonuclease HI
MTYYEELRVHFDGASKNNPRGPAGCGWVIYGDDGGDSIRVARGNEYLGYNVSSNQAEYEGLEQALQYIYDQNIGCGTLNVRGDSELVINQLKGSYQVRNSNLRQHYDNVMSDLSQVDADEIVYSHVSRFRNREADRLANKAIRDESGYISP